MPDDVNDTLDRLCRPDAAAWLESGDALPAVRRLAIAYDNAQIDIAALRGKLAAAELALLNATKRAARDHAPDELDVPVWLQTMRAAEAL